MKLNYTDGCVCTSLTIDDVETIDMPIEKLQDAIEVLFRKEYEENNYSLGTYIQDIIYSLATEENTIEHDFSSHHDYIECYRLIGESNISYKYINLFWNNLIIIDHEIWDGTIKLDERVIDDFCKFIHQVTDVSILQTIFCTYMERHGDYDCTDKPCECCGDHIRTYTLEI